MLSAGWRVLMLSMLSVCCQNISSKRSDFGEGIPSEISRGKGMLRGKKLLARWQMLRATDTEYVTTPPLDYFLNYWYLEYRDVCQACWEIPLSKANWLLQEAGNPVCQLKR